MCIQIPGSRDDLRRAVAAFALYSRTRAKRVHFTCAATDKFRQLLFSSLISLIYNTQSRVYIIHSGIFSTIRTASSKSTVRALRYMDNRLYRINARLLLCAAANKKNLTNVP